MNSKKKLLQYSGILVLIIASFSFLMVNNLQLGITSENKTDSVSAMTCHLYLKATGETQGNMPGGSTVAGKEGLIEVIGFHHNVVSPRDAASGLPTGKRQHKPLTITKRIDKSSPLLYTSWSSNENMQIELTFVRTDAVGSSEDYFKIELLNAHIANIRQLAMPEGTSESISFVYESIVWTWIPEGISAQDNWSDDIA